MNYDDTKFHIFAPTHSCGQVALFDDRDMISSQPPHSNISRHIKPVHELGVSDGQCSLVSITISKSSFYPISIVGNPLLSLRSQ